MPSAEGLVKAMNNADLAALVQRARHLDLVTNVFINGQHGSYRSLRVPVRRPDV